MKKVAAEFKSIGSQALYLSCYSHSINLAVPDTKVIRTAPVFYALKKGCFSMLQEVSSVLVIWHQGVTKKVKYTRYGDRGI